MQNPVLKVALANHSVWLVFACQNHCVFVQSVGQSDAESSIICSGVFYINIVTVKSCSIFLYQNW